MTLERKISFTKNKYFCFQLSFWKNDKENIFHFIIRLNKRSDHAGLNLSLSIWKFMIDFQIYDNRHWDYDKDAWEVYD